MWFLFKKESELRISNTSQFERRRKSVNGSMRDKCKVFLGYKKAGWHFAKKCVMFFDVSRLLLHRREHAEAKI